MADFGTAKLAGMLSMGDARSGSSSSARMTLASVATAAREQTTMVGTVLWMAPEVLSGGSDYGQVKKQKRKKEEELGEGEKGRVRGEEEEEEEEKSWGKPI